MVPPGGDAMTAPWIPTTVGDADVPPRSPATAAPPRFASAAGALPPPVPPCVTVRTPLFSIDKVVPDCASPVPAVIDPAPENCVQVIAVVPRVTVPLVVHTQPVRPLADPPAC